MDMRPDKNRYYLQIAKDASARSTCLKRRYGAVLVKDDHIISTGYNGAPRGDEDPADGSAAARSGLRLADCQAREIECHRGGPRRPHAGRGRGADEPRGFGGDRLEGSAGRRLHVRPGAGLVLASDGFLPFGDTVALAAQYGVTAIVQPGGSIRDEESIAKADELGITMLFTGVRHFKH